MQPLIHFQLEMYTRGNDIRMHANVEVNGFSNAVSIPILLFEAQGQITHPDHPGRPSRWRTSATSPQRKLRGEDL